MADSKNVRRPFSSLVAWVSFSWHHSRGRFWYQSVEDRGCSHQRASPVKLPFQCFENGPFMLTGPLASAL